MAQQPPQPPAGESPYRIAGRLPVRTTLTIRVGSDGTVEGTEKFIRGGMSPTDARRRAMLRFGGVARVQEETRDEIRPALDDDVEIDRRCRDLRALLSEH